MSFLALTWARTAPVRTPHQRIVLMELAYRAKDDGTEAYPSKASLAEVAMCDKRTVARSLATLRDLGLIREGNQSAAWKIEKRYRPVVYDLMIPAEWYSRQQLGPINRERAERGLMPITAALRPPLNRPAGEAGCHPSPDETGAEGGQGVTPEGWHTVTPEGGQADTPSDVRGGTQVVQGGHSAPQTSPKKRTTLVDKSTNHARVPARDDDPTVDLLASTTDDEASSPHLFAVAGADDEPQQPDLFDEFWRIYPRKEGKLPASKAFRRAARATSPRFLINQIERWVELWRAAGKRKQFIPQAATWLNNERWNDEPPEPENPPATTNSTTSSPTDDRVRGWLELGTTGTEPRS